MQRLPPVLSLQELEEYRDKLKQQQAAVSKGVSSTLRQFVVLSISLARIVTEKVLISLTLYIKYFCFNILFVCFYSGKSYQ